jgi:hypothetical protein
MRFPVVIERQSDGWEARVPIIPEILGIGPTRESALQVHVMLDVIIGVRPGQDITEVEI